MAGIRIHPVAQAILRVCQRLDRLGFAPGATASLCVRDEDLLWLTPPGASWEALTPEQLWMRWPDGRWLGASADNGAPVAESPQAAFYQTLAQRQPDTNAFLLARPPQAWRWAHTGTFAPSGRLPGSPEAWTTLTIAAMEAPEAVWLAAGRLDSFPKSGARLTFLPTLGWLALGDNLTSAVALLETLDSAAAAFGHLDPARLGVPAG